VPPKVKSSTVTISIREKPGLTITVDKTSGYVGDTFTFTGYYTIDGKPYPDREIVLYKDGVEIGRTKSDIDGAWTIKWTADSAGTFTFYAEGL